MTYNFPSDKVVVVKTNDYMACIKLNQIESIVIRKKEACIFINLIGGGNDIDNYHCFTGDKCEELLDAISERM